MTSAAFPARLDGHLDSHLSRWLWLVKWLLAIPHMIVLCFLWIAFVVLSVVAFFAIALTGRYPRGIFDFNLGVLRWTWRVAFYTYSALGTDRYPPFSLAECPDYPATLSIAYPQHLSRGLVFVKWLLVIPHLLIVGIFAGFGSWLVVSEGGDFAFGGGLVTLLAIFAGIALLVTGRYPQQIFDLVLGLDRWVLRVAAYAALMTDAYPPFRLDLGGPDPATVALPAAAPPAAEVRPDPTSAGRAAFAIGGGLLAILAVAVLAAGGVMLWAHGTQRDGAGFLMSPSERFSTPTHALVSSPLQTHVHGHGWMYSDDMLGTVRLEAAGDGPLFVGIARSADVDAYLAGVAHELVDDIGAGREAYTRVGGAAAAVPPAEAPIWVASSSGAGERAVTWKVRDGEWSVVVMNPDGSRDVAADVRIGARMRVLPWMAAGLLALGLLLAAAAAACLYGAARRGAGPPATG